MQEAAFSPYQSGLLVQMAPAVSMTDEQFFRFCAQNRDLRIERTANGQILIMAPAGGATGARNSDITMQLTRWAKEDGTGVAFDSSARFNLPNKASRAPDAAWVRRERLAELTPEEKEKFLPLCPDFVIELRSPSDRLHAVRDKMQEYMENGARLGWLIDPVERQVFVYRPEAPVEHLEDPERIAGDPVLPGFTLDLTTIWEPGF